MVWKRIKRTVKGVAKVLGKAAVTAAAVRYGQEGGMTNLIKDVKMMKRLINVEKKRYTLCPADTKFVAQIYNNVSGHFSIDCTPVPVSGTGFDDRTGSSIKLLNSVFDFQFIAQTGLVSQMKLKILVLRNGGITSTVAGGFNDTTLVTNLLEKNKWISLSNSSLAVYDYASDFNPDKTGNWKVIKTIKRTIKPDTISGQTNILPVKFNVNFKNHHVKYDQDTVDVTKGQLAFIIVADSGNFDPANTSTLFAVPITTNNTGLFFRYEVKHIYTDN